MPNGFMGNSSLPLLGRSSSCFNATEGCSTSTYVHRFSFLPAKTVNFNQAKVYKQPLARKPFGIVTFDYENSLFPSLVRRAYEEK